MLDSDLLARFRDSLRDRGSGARPAAAATEILQLKRRCGMKLPLELEALFLEMDGSDGVDENMIRFWPASEASCVTGTNGLTYVVFSDWSILARLYAIAIASGPPGKREIVDIDPPVVRRRVAGGLSEFVATYIKDPLSLVVP